MRPFLLISSVTVEDRNAVDVQRMATNVRTATELANFRGIIYLLYSFLL